MQKTAWIVLVVVGLTLAGCAAEPEKPAGGPAKGAPAEKAAAPAESPPAAPAGKQAAEDPFAAPAPSPAAPGTAPAYAAPPETAPPAVAGKAGKEQPEGKGGSVLGAMGKALMKAGSESGKSKTQKATDQAPPTAP
ncbi:MAG: hypothetical protein ABSF26_16970 [Thermoguttaceae bacterium]|jgi:hypothetical protein